MAQLRVWMFLQLLTLFVATQGTVSEAQEIPTPGTKTTDPTSRSAEGPNKKQLLESWIGWIETDNAQFRWVVEIDKSNKDKWVGTSQTPDLTEQRANFKELKLQQSDWSLLWSDPLSNMDISYAGKQEGDRSVSGILMIGGENLPVSLTKVDQVPNSSPLLLGAEGAWIDSVTFEQLEEGKAASDLKPKYRFRVYSQGPFASKTPRILFDAVALDLVGVPSQLKEVDGKLEFNMPSLELEYRAVLDAPSQTLIGTMRRKDQKEPLELRMVSTEVLASMEKESKKSAREAAKSMNESTEKSPASATADAADSVRIKMEPSRESRSPLDLAKNETAFTIQVESKFDKKNSGKSRALGGTLTVPAQTSDRPIPSVVILSTYSKTDRDGTMGENRFYRDLARWLSTQGIASVRVDDRGVGDSDPAGPEYSHAQACEEVEVLIENLKRQPGFDPNQIGLLGHGEGADLAVQTAAVNSSIAFLVLLNPPGVDGRSLLQSKAKAIAELEPTDANTLTLLFALNKGVHEIALSQPTDPADLQKKVQSLVSSNLASVVKNVAGKANSDIAQIRKSLETKLLADVLTLNSQWSREFLAEDPVNKWMLLQCPVLAIWAQKDVEVPPGESSRKISSAMARTAPDLLKSIQISGVDHWFHATNNGSPENYVEKAETSSELFQAIADWLKVSL